MIFDKVMCLICMAFCVAMEATVICWLIDGIKSRWGVENEGQ